MLKYVFSSIHLKYVKLDFKLDRAKISFHYAMMKLNTFLPASTNSN